jgi:uncharacterized Zn finger protein
MRWWQDYEPTTPRPVRDGLKARAQRGSFSQTWWGRRWIEALEGFGWDTRLARGRAYARRGQVVDLEVAPGQAKARVQGSQATPYRVQIRLAPLTDEQWQAAFAALAGEAAHAARLLAGELPEAIEPLFAAAGASLLPGQAKDLQMDCSCPDWAVPCKHVAALHYLLAEELDRDPFLLFTLRGKEREAVLAGLRQARGAPAEAAPTPEQEAAPEDATLPLEGFWEPARPLVDWRVAPAPPAVQGGVLRRLGPPDFAADPAALERYLAEVYARISERALDASLEGSPAEADEDAG